MKRFYLLLIGTFLFLGPLFLFSKSSVGTAQAQCFQCNPGGWCEQTGQQYCASCMSGSCTPDSGWGMVPCCYTNCSACPASGGGGGAPTPTPTPQQVYPIAGRVVDVNGNGVSGVTVHIQSLTTTTDSNGNYSMSGYIGTDGYYGVWLQIPSGYGSARARTIDSFVQGDGLTYYHNTLRKGDPAGERDTRETDDGYYHQQHDHWDCAGPGANNGPLARCNFTLFPKVNNASCVGVTRPSEPGLPSGTLLRGKAYYARVFVQNTGDYDWTKVNTSNPYRLGSQAPDNNISWGINRVELPDAFFGPVDYRPGDQVSFDMTVRADTVGTYNFQWRMLKEGIEWFGATCDGGTYKVVDAVSPGPLSVINMGSATGGRRALTSGKTSVQGGSDWNNPINVQFSVTQGTGTPEQLITGFYTGAQVNSRQELLDRTADPNNGFTLMYTTNNAYCGSSFCILYWNGSTWWQPLLTVAQGGFLVRSGGNLLYTVSRVSSTPTSAVWNVRFDKNFGSKSLKTATYVTDTNGTSSFEGAKTATAQ